MDGQSSIAGYSGRTLKFADSKDAAAELAQSFPFAFLCNRAGQLLQHGHQLPKLCPGLKVGMTLANLFEMESPQVGLSSGVWWENPQLSQLYLLRCRGTGTLLPGEVIAMPGGEQFLFVGSPWFNDVTAMINTGLERENFAVSNAGIRLFLELKARQTQGPDFPAPGESPDRQPEGARRDKPEPAQTKAAGQPLPQDGGAEECTSNPLMAGAEITEQISTEAALRAERELLGAILNSMLEGVIVIDETQRVRLLNPAAEKATGWHRDDARGRQINEVFTVAGVSYPEGGLVNTQEEWLATALTDRAGGGRLSLADSVVIQTVNGRRMTVSASAVPMTGASGEVMGGLLVFRDVSALAEIEQMREDFVHAVSHELNTPLTSITGFIANLRQEPEMPLALRKEFLGIVEKQATRLHNLVKDILEISRVESGGANYDDQLLDLREVVEASLMEVKPLAEERKIEIQSRLPETALPFFGDAERLQSVATNLLSNAIKFSHEAGRVELRLEQTGGKIILVVRDFGLGIPPEARNYIFDRFYRVTRPGTQIPGTGLGLAIVQRIVRHYSGRIEVESILDEGSCFQVILPPRNPVRDPVGTVAGT